MKSWIIKGLYFLLIFFSCVYAVLGVETNSYSITCSPDVSTIKFGGFFQECKYTWKLNSSLTEDVAFCFNTPLQSATVNYFNGSKWLDITGLFQYKNFSMYKGDCYYIQNVKWNPGETKTIRLQYFPKDFNTPKWDTYFGNISAKTVDLILDPLFNTYNYEIGTNRSGAYNWRFNTDILSSNVNYCGYSTVSVNSCINTYSGLFDNGGLPSFSNWDNLNNYIPIEPIVNVSINYSTATNYKMYARIDFFYNDSTVDSVASSCAQYGALYAYSNVNKTVLNVSTYFKGATSACAAAGAASSSILNSSLYGYSRARTNGDITSNNISLGLLVNTFKISSGYTGEAAVNLTFDNTNWIYMNLSNSSQINLSDNVSDNNKLSYKLFFLSSPLPISSVTNVTLAFSTSESVALKHGFWITPSCSGFTLNNMTVTSAGNPTIAMICPDLTCTTANQTATIVGNTATFTPFSIPRGTPIPILWNSSGSWTSRYLGGVGPLAFGNFNVSNWIYNQANNTEAHDLALVGYSCAGGIGTTLYNFSVNFNGLSNIINISIYDEQTMSLITEAVNVTLTDLTNPQIMISSTSNGLASFSNLNFDQYEVKLQSVNFTTRTYYISLGNATNGFLNAYLLRYSVAQNFSVCWYDSNGANVNGLHVWQYVLTNTSYIDVKDQLTTVQGISYHDFLISNYYLFNYNSSVYKVQPFVLNPPKNNVVLSDGCNYDVTLPFNYVSQIVTPLNITVSVSWSNVTNHLLLSYISNVSASNYSFIVQHGNLTVCTDSSSLSSHSFDCDLTGNYGWNIFTLVVDGVNFYGGLVEVPGLPHLFDFLNQSDAGFFAFFIELVAIMFGMIIGGFWGALAMGVVGLVVIMVMGLLSMITSVMIVVAIIVSLVIGFGVKRY